MLYWAGIGEAGSEHPLARSILLLPVQPDFDKLQSRKRGLGLAALDNTQEFQYNEYQDDDDQSMYPITGTWKPWAYIPTEKAEQPQY